MLYFPGKWDSLFLIKYFLSKLLLHPQSFPLPPILFFCFLFSIFSNYLGLLLFLVHDLICKTQVNILKIFQTALCFISKNQLHIAQGVAESTSPWQNCNSAGNVKESCLQPDQSNHIFPPLQDSAICYRALWPFGDRKVQSSSKAKAPSGRKQMLSVY